VAGPVGTVVEVTRLFFNAPARQKFLKTTRSEELKIKQWLMQYVYCRHMVAFRFESDGRELFVEPSRASLLDRARALIGAGIVTFEHEVNGIQVVGALAHPSEARSEARGLTLIVNGRLVADRMVLRAVKDGFGGSLKEREFPVGVVSLTIPGTEVDVNVHPQKSEVRFRNSSAVYVAVLRSIQAGLAELKRPMGVARPQPPPGGGGHRVMEPRPSYSITRDEVPRSSRAPLLPLQTAHLSFQSFPSAAETPKSGVADPHTPFSFRALTFRGQLFECYLLCEANGVFYVVDMHAAHERYQFNRVRNALRTRDRMAQGLLLPVTLMLSEKEQENLRARQVILEDLGFSFEFSAERTGQVTVKEIPSILVDRNFEGALREIASLDADEQCGIAPLDYLLDQIAARVACHASIRSGKRLTTPEVEALFALLDSSECSAACPHGRPVVIGFSEQEVEQWFGRDR
jgi:DNA mismatch repair protein MutL